jgi:small conductance mechanosensitive channel
VILSIRYATIAAILVAFIVAAVALRIAHVLLRRIVGRLDIVDADNRSAVQTRARQLSQSLTVLAYSVAALASVSLALSRFGLNEARWEPREVARWFATHGINVALIFAGAVVVVRAAHLAIDHMRFKLSHRRAATDLEWQRRAATLGGILVSLVSTVVAFVAILMILRELSVDVLPLLTGAGIAGLAIGFGAQNLVRDIISGFFLILEDQVRVGDLARVNGVTGVVEQVNLRTIVVRDGEGAVQVFANGTIATLANLSKQYSFAIVDMRVAYTENVDRVIGTAREVGASMSRDAAWTGLLLDSLDVIGLVSLSDGAATLRVKFKTLPLNQAKVANELRRRLMSAFVGRGIKPYA